ncbi:hypothetical protein NXG84_26165 [Klebsiella pneumoniae]|nr:hypothetical protein [Klebsiella pneumoniae]MDS7154012.1 hypothetical protein [Klebsiella pneumoniae]MDS7233253.1 hypothetical protein [Klebsiella pneumoniae]MDS7453508.1 hypothetical protein [Klebsiella pneumoniae]MDS7593368.1 hypothetical protein [Klebsiella pneumoniae]
MRKPEEIRADIEELTKELEAVKIHESRQVAAVNILYNLGWTHDPHKGWQKPAPKSSDYKAPLKAGELATWEDKTLGGTVYIRAVGETRSVVSHVRNVGRLGVDVHNSRFTVENDTLTIRPREYFIGRKW